MAGNPKAMPPCPGTKRPAQICLQRTAFKQWGIAVQCKRGTLQMAVSRQGVRAHDKDRGDCQAWARGLHHDAYQLRCLNPNTAKGTNLKFYTSLLPSVHSSRKNQCGWNKNPCFDVLLTRRKRGQHLQLIRWLYAQSETKLHINLCVELLILARKSSMTETLVKTQVRD